MGIPQMNTENPPEEKPKNEPEGNPLEELKKQLEGILGKDRNVRFEFVPPFGAASPDGGGTPQQKGSSEEILEKISKFSMKPREIRDYLDKFVIKQDEAKKSSPWQSATTTTTSAAAWKTPPSPSGSTPSRTF